MEKSEMMKKFEVETGKQSAILTVDIGFAEPQFPSKVYADWIEAELLKGSVKAAAYDRLTTGGRNTLKEWANIFGMNMAVDEKGDGIVSKYPLEFRPLYDGYKVAGYWTIRAGYPYTMFNIPFYIIDFSGSWQYSLTLPDGWEDK